MDKLKTLVSNIEEFVYKETTFSSEGGISSLDGNVFVSYYIAEFFKKQ